MSVFDVLDCKTCGLCCAGTIHIFNGEVGAEDKEKGGVFMHTMPLKEDKSCKFLIEGLCSKYKDPNYPMECKFYPFRVDLNNELYIAASCPRFNNIVQSVIKDPIYKQELREMRFRIVNETTDEMKIHWDSLIHNAAIKIKVFL